MGGDIKNIESHKVAMYAVSDAFVIVRNILFMQVGRPLIERGQSSSAPLSDTQKFIATSFTMGPKDAVFCFPLPLLSSFGVMLHFRGQFVLDFKVSYREAIKHMVQGLEYKDKNTGMLSQALGKTPNIRKYADKIASAAK